MKKYIIICLCVCFFKVKCQLPPNAQALYNEFYNTNTFVAQGCLNNGAQVYATADGNSFYLKWFPTGATPSLTPLMVAFHGTGSNAFNVIDKWYQKALLRGVGIIAVQWYRGAAASPPNDYFDDNTLYTYLDTALKRIKYPANKALLNGFSRGSARSYALQFLDVQPSGKNYFCTILSNAGKPDSLYPFYIPINNGTYGHTFCNGKQWAMYCGGQDPNPGRDGCPAMNSAKNNWVIANGGSVGLFIQDPTLGHSGLTDTPAYMDSVLKFYLPCFNVNSLKELEHENNFKLYPNPVDEVFNIHSNYQIGETLYIYDCYGTEVKKNVIENNLTKLNVGDLRKGIYVLRLGDRRSKFVKN